MMWYKNLIYLDKGSYYEENDTYNQLWQLQQEHDYNTNNN